MARVEKQYRQLDALEADFRLALVVELNAAARGKNGSVFCVRPYNPFRELRQQTSAKTEALLADADAILALRKKLGECLEGSPASRLHWFCQKWGDLEDDHRSDARGLAKQFLVELGEDASAA